MKNHQISKAGLAILCLLAVSSFGWGQAAVVPPPQTFTTTVYFDYSAFATTNGYLTSNPLSNKFHFRRAYFTYENKISDYLKFRFRYDADNTVNITSVDFAGKSTKKDDKLRPFIKHLFLEWSQDWLQSRFNIGMIETLAFKPSEDRWGLRSVAKTLVDGYKDITGTEIKATSADIGVSWKGALAKQLRFALGVHNGSAYSHAETDKFKKISGYLQLVPVAGLSIIGYGDYEKQNDNQKAVTTKIDVFFDMISKINISFEWFNYNNEMYMNTDNSHYQVGGFSVFGTYKIDPDKFTVFARYDHYQPNSRLSVKDQDLIILGLDWFAWGATGRLQPNVWIYSYKDAARKQDVVFNLTFFLSF